MTTALLSNWATVFTTGHPIPICENRAGHPTRGQRRFLRQTGHRREASHKEERHAPTPRGWAGDTRCLGRRPLAVPACSNRIGLLWMEPRRGQGPRGLSVPGVSGVWLKIAYVLKAPLAEPRYSTVTINFRFNVALPVSCGRSLRALWKERTFLNGFILILTGRVRLSTLRRTGRTRELGSTHKEYWSVC